MTLTKEILPSLTTSNLPLNVRDLLSLVSFFEYFILFGVRKSTIHSLAGSNDLKRSVFFYNFHREKINITHHIIRFSDVSKSRFQISNQQCRVISIKHFKKKYQLEHIEKSEELFTQRSQTSKESKLMRFIKLVQYWISEYR